MIRSCINLRRTYTSGNTGVWCHTMGDELARVVDFKIRKQFQKECIRKGYESWKNAYAIELSHIVGMIWEFIGVAYNVNAENILLS